MLTFEKVLKVFQAYLDDDPLYEVVQTSLGYTYANFLEDKITGNKRELTVTETGEIQQRCRELLEKCRET